MRRLNRVTGATRVRWPLIAPPLPLPPLRPQARLSRPPPGPGCADPWDLCERAGAAPRPGSRRRGGTMDPNDQDELVSVSVRRRDLPAVYAYLGRLMAGEEPATDQGEQAWRAEDVAALKHHPRLHRAAGTMFDLAAKRPGEPVTY